MNRILSRAQMRAFDRHAIDACGVPGVVLMENAGRGATDVLEREVLGGDARGRRVVVVAGLGNNGGDGFVLARHLLLRGADVRVLVVGDPARFVGDARVNVDAFSALGRSFETVVLREPLERALADADAIVDALFGTGLDRPIAGLFASVVEAINAASAPKLALDIPSGLDADTGQPLGVAVRADVTVTFAHRKLGLCTPRGAELAGRIVVADIGVPGSLLGEETAAFTFDAADAARAIRPRPSGAHKSSAGDVLIFAGSPGKVGASLLVARGAMRAGAGLATIATFRDAAERLDARVLETMTATIDDADAAESLEDRVDALLARRNAVVIGPGFGTDAKARAVLARVLERYPGPIVVDADAITLAAREPELLAPARGRLVLTPHPGEASRLLGTTSAEVEADRFAAARALVDATGAVVVLKGSRTIVAAPSGGRFVSEHGSPALATAGAGDVLAGIVGALACGWPQLELVDAACVGVHVHAAAAEAWSEENADRGLLASDVADRVPRVIGALLRRRRAPVGGNGAAG
jgi:NAD(P)H-hydrate epimerase